MNGGGCIALPIPLPSANMGDGKVTKSLSYRCGKPSPTDRKKKRSTDSEFLSHSFPDMTTFFPTKVPAEAACHYINCFSPFRSICAHTGSRDLCSTRWHYEHEWKFKEFSHIKWSSLSIFFTITRSIAFVWT